MNREERFDHLAPKPLDRVPICLWADVWCSLNRLEWHESLGEKPDGWDSCTTLEEIKQTRCAAVAPLIRWIEDEIGTKACLRYMKTVDGMTDQQFEDWWDSKAFESARKAKKRRTFDDTLSAIIGGAFGSALAILFSVLTALAIVLIRLSPIVQAQTQAL